MATAKNERSALGELLVEMGLVEREQLNLALAQQRASGGRLGRILVDRKAVEEDRMTKALAGRLGLEAVSLGTLKIHEKVLALLPAALAVKYGVLPIAIKRTSQAEFIYVVVADPLDSEALSEIGRAAQRDLRVLLAPATELDRAIDLHYKVAKPQSEVSSALRDRALGSSAGFPAPQTASPLPPPPLPAKVEKRGSIPITMVPTPSSPAQMGRVKSGAGFATPTAPLPGVRSEGLEKRVELRRASSMPAVSAPLTPPTPALGTPAASVGPRGATSTPARPLPPAPPPRLGTNAPLRVDPRPAQSSPASPRPDAEDGKRARSSTGTPPPQGMTAGPARTQLPVASLGSRAGATGLVPQKARSTADVEQNLDQMFDTLDGSSAEDVVPTTSLAPKSPSEPGGGDWENITDWPPNIHDPDPIKDESVELGVLSQAVAARMLPAPRSESDPGTMEPVTSEVHVVEVDYAIEPTHSGRIEPSPYEGSLEVFELPDGVEEIKTSQVELSELEAAEVQRLLVAERPTPASTHLHDGRAVPGMLELPVDISSAPSPFENFDNVEISVGLERTGIIPAVDWDNDGFVPPPLVRPAVEPLLAGFDDIPVSAAHVEVRAVDRNGVSSRREDRSHEEAHDGSPASTLTEHRFDSLLEARNAVVDEEPKGRRSEAVVEAAGGEASPPFDGPHLLEEANVTPLRLGQAAKLSTNEDPDLSEMPVIEPSSLVSLMDDDGFSRAPERREEDPDERSLRGRHEPLPERGPLEISKRAPVVDISEEEGTNPRMNSRGRSSEDRPIPLDGEDIIPLDGGRDARASARAFAEPVESPESLREEKDATPPNRSAALGPTSPADRVHGEDEAQLVVAALVRGESLNSAERAQLVLVLGRLLLQKGLVTQEELVAELRR